MKIQDVLEDIEKLKNLNLKSIKNGADVLILEVDWTDRRINIVTSSGNHRSRPFSEIERIWSALCDKPAVHVDSELGGSGSSRNQPETILANLPYIEWFRHDRKKHLVKVGTPSHPYGTLKMMDDFEADKLKEENKLDKINFLENTSIAEIIVVSSDLKDNAEKIEIISGKNGIAISQGVYEFSLPMCNLRLVAHTKTSEGIELGTYLVMPGSPVSNTISKLVKIGKDNFTLQKLNGLSMLFKINN